MGKGGSQTSTTTYTQSPEQRKILQGAINRYMPNGTLPDRTPEFDFDNNQALRDRGEHFVSKFSDDTYNAMDATRARFGEAGFGMDEAMNWTRAGGEHAGMFQGAPDGWNVGEDGVARYHDFETGVQKYMNPFIKNVIDRGVDDLDYARQRTMIGGDNDTVGRDSFGGTRQAVRQGVTNRGFADASERLISGNLLQGFKEAAGQYNQGFTQGQTALNYNTGIENADREAQARTGVTLGNQYGQQQDFYGKDINALGAVGGMIEDRDQRVRDASRANQMQDETYGLDIAGALSGLTPPPSSTTTSKSSPGGSIWGTIGSTALQMGGTALMSDERAKEGVKDSDPEDALAQIRKLVPKSFNYTMVARELGAPAGRRTGFMAQDLEKATGRESPTGPGGFKGVDIHEHIGRLTQAVQALDAQIQDRYKHRKAA
jgi:hypothetical protein